MSVLSQSSTTSRFCIPGPTFILLPFSQRRDSAPRVPRSFVSRT
jgi:hypothetical protein